jgi:hypothetical protein
MPSTRALVEQVALPSQSGVATAFESVDLADAFAIQLPSDASKNPDVLARFIFSVQPPWIAALTSVRDAIGAGLGLKTAKHLATLSSDPAAKRISIFRVFGTSASEVVLGENDKHLDIDSLHTTRATEYRQSTDTVDRRAAEVRWPKESA